MYAKVLELQEEIERAIGVAAERNRFDYLASLIQTRCGLERTRAALRDQIRLLNETMGLLKWSADNENGGNRFPIS
jgi:hypothetical protein